MSILGSFKAEHEALWRSADLWEGGELSDQELLDLLREVVRVHFRDEERFLFPELASPESLGQIEECITEHHEITRMIDQATENCFLSRYTSEEKPYHPLAKVLKTFKEHIEKEEETLFRVAESQITPARLRELQGYRTECSCQGH